MKIIRVTQEEVSDEPKVRNLKQIQAEINIFTEEMKPECVSKSCKWCRSFLYPYYSEWGKLMLPKYFCDCAPETNEVLAGRKVCRFFEERVV